VPAEGLTPEPWWLWRLPITFLPCGHGFFHEVGAKLLVEIGPEGGRRHNSPLITLSPFGGMRPVASLGSGLRRSRLTTPLSILPFVYPYELLLLTENKTESKETLCKPKAVDWQEPSVLSSHYSVSVSLQGVHYL
jgi:hypothetical protein